MIGLEPKTFQENAVTFLLDRTTNKKEQKIIMQSPTGERVIIVTGCINVLVSRVSEAFIKDNSCIA